MNKAGAQGFEIRMSARGSVLNVVGRLRYRRKLLPRNTQPTVTYPRVPHPPKSLAIHLMTVQSSGLRLGRTAPVSDDKESLLIPE